MYHRVSATAQPNRYTVSAGEFERQMLALRDAGYQVLSLADTIAQLTNSGDSPGKPVCITFDDGFQEAHDFAAPILGRLGFPATFFLVSGLMGGTNRWDRAAGAKSEYPLMNWAEAQQLLVAGFDVGSHTISHPALPELSSAGAVEEIRGSKQEIESKLGVAIRYFAYPYGRFDRRIRDLVSEAGYEGACSTLSGFATQENDCFALRRIEVFGRDSLRVFHRKLRFGANEMSAGDVLRYYVKRGVSRLVAAAR